MSVSRTVIVTVNVFDCQSFNTSVYPPFCMSAHAPRMWSCWICLGGFDLPIVSPPSPALWWAELIWPDCPSICLPVLLTVHAVYTSSISIFPDVTAFLPLNIKRMKSFIDIYMKEKCKSDQQNEQNRVQWECNFKIISPEMTMSLRAELLHNWIYNILHNIQLQNIQYSHKLNFK